MSIVDIAAVRSARKRLSPEESRTTALEAARALLIEAGPQAVTLKAVGGRIGRTHANLLHHFGSASGLQAALAQYLADSICATIEQAVMHARESLANSAPAARNGEAVRAIVDLTFDAFDKEGAGALASWMLVTGNEDALNPIVEAIHRLVDRLGEDGHADRELHEDTLALVLTALGDALLGAPLAASLGLPRTRARELAAAQLARSVEHWVKG